MKHLPTITGTVERGQGLGREKLVPTLNIQVTDGVLPDQLGVYVCTVHHSGEQYEAVANIGKRPTVSTQEHIQLEVYVFKLDDNWYEEEVTITLLDFLRPERSFGSIQELKNQIQRDTVAAQLYFASQRMENEE